MSSTHLQFIKYRIGKIQRRMGINLKVKKGLLKQKVKYFNNSLKNIYKK